MKPTDRQCELATIIGLALMKEAGAPAIDLLRAAKLSSPVLGNRIRDLLALCPEGRNLPSVDAAAQEFYELEEGGQDGKNERSADFRLRLSPVEKAELQRQAEAAGETASGYIRSALNLTP